MSAGRKHRRGMSKRRIVVFPDLEPMFRPPATFADLPSERQETINLVGRNIVESETPSEFQTIIYDAAHELKISIKDSAWACVAIWNELVSKTPSLRDDDGTISLDESVYKAKVVFLSDYEKAKKHYRSLFAEWMKDREKNHDDDE